MQRAQATLDGGAPEPVVLKVLLKNPFDDPAGPLALATERAATLRHPSLIRLRAHALKGPYSVLVMEGVRLPPLQGVLQRQGPFGPDAVRDMIATAGEAFAELHAAGGLYGVLTSHNVFVDTARPALRFSALSITGLLSQTRGWKEFLGVDADAAGYLIPEQFSNQRLSPSSDQYVLGQIAIEMLTGRPAPPADVRTPMDLAAKDLFFANPTPFLASMGVYVFTRHVLLEMLEQESGIDFGRELIPGALARYDVQPYLYRGYWADVGTIESYYNANVMLGAEKAPFRFWDPKRPTYTRQRHLSSARLTDCHVSHSIVSEGSFLDRCQVSNSVIGIRARVGRGSRIHRSVVIGRAISTRNSRCLACRRLASDATSRSIAWSSTRTRASATV